MEGAYTASVEEVLKHFGGVSEKCGLSDAQVIEAKKRYGKNGESPDLVYVPIYEYLSSTGQCECECEFLELIANTNVLQLYRKSPQHHYGNLYSSSSRTSWSSYC